MALVSLPKVNVLNLPLLFSTKMFVIRAGIHKMSELQTGKTMITGVIPISLFLLATRTVLRKAAIDRGVRLATGRYGCRYRGVSS